MQRNNARWVTRSQQDALLQWLRTAQAHEVKAALQDKNDRHEINEIFNAWQMRTQIRQLRMARGWTQQDLADRIGMKQSAIARLENMYAPVNVSIMTLLRLARIFDVALKIRFCSWLSLIADIINMRCRLRPYRFEDDPAFREQPSTLK